MKIERLERQFSYAGMMLPDPDPNLTPEQVRDVYANAYPEITTADITGPETNGDKLVYTFKRAAGTKGASFVRQDRDGLTYIEVAPAGQAGSVLDEFIVAASSRINAWLDVLARWIDKTIFYHGN
ncbi:PRTRC system protein C [Azonexus hydrophilus]|uniref:PRTRC system protein C n=1 Tax=Azonexus hydrophilus TaxID=418702 RepID=A0ABZ2XMM4_9RHOO